MTDTVRLLHASDVHVDNSHEGCDGIMRLADAAVSLDIDLVLLVGDTFDDNRVRPEVIATFVEHLERVPVPVVILPGNHDPYFAGSIYDRTELPGHVTVLRDGNGATHAMPHLGLELWGRPHVSFADHRPFDGLPPRGEQPWQVALAHGHLVRTPDDRHRAYQITHEEIAASNRDYVALGHWDVQHDVSVGGVTAWYSGSPRRYATCALVTLSGVGASRTVQVEPVRLG
jgi:DNA repair exonuclease SbcCD nuclease subunit